MPLPAVSPDRINQALHTFDVEYRDKPEWTDWEADRAHKFAVTHAGRLYPVKMVLSLATGVPRSEFSGGARPGQAAWYAQRAGLAVVRLPGRERARTGADEDRRYWAVCVDPKRYRVLEAVRDLKVTTWTTKGRPLAVGDRLAIWQTRDRQGRRGIVALAAVVEPPSVRGAADPAYWVEPDGTAPEQRVGVRLVRIPEPAWLGGQHDETLSALSVARARGGSVFKIRPDQWAALLEALGGWPAREHAVAIEEMVPRAPPAAQGYGLSVRERRAIELHAMRLATEHYRRSWDEVRDVSATACFDLLCRSPGGRELHVEVKGTTTAGATVLVTCNEVDHARREFPGVALVVVHGITLHSDEDRVPVADGGMMIVHEPWDVSICELTPLAFECALPRAPVSLPADIIDGAGPAGPCQMHVVPVVRQSETSDS